MSKGPGLFSDIGKKAKDLLTKDYSYDQNLSVTTYSKAGVELTSTALKKGGLSAGDIVVLYKYKNSIINVKVDTESNILTTVTVKEILPSTSAIISLRVPDYKSGKAYVQYIHDHVTFTTTASLKRSPAVDMTATIGTPSFVVGAEAGYDTALSTLIKYNAGVSVRSPDLNASIILADKGNSLRASYVHHFDQQKMNSCVVEISRRFSTNENTVTVGGSYAIDPLTSLKVRLNNHGNLGTVLQHQLRPKSILTVSSEFDTKALDRNPRFGLSLRLKP